MTNNTEKLRKMTEKSCKYCHGIEKNDFFSKIIKCLSPESSKLVKCEVCKEDICRGCILKPISCCKNYPAPKIEICYDCYNDMSNICEVCRTKFYDPPTREKPHDGCQIIEISTESNIMFVCRDCSPLEV